MARLILKSPYLKCDGNHSVSGYLQYIGTRERVELLPDDRPPTRKQEQLVRKLVKDFPEAKKLDEYLDYEAKPTKANASAFITRALEENWPAVQQSDGYMKYIATRPRAERLGDHGLFGDEDGVDLEKAMRELDQYTGNVWTHIISLKREDAARLGYDNAKAWMNLLRANRNDIAAAMNIPPNHFRWYAAYHDEGDHPHVHMMAWSTVPEEAYLTKEGIRQIKSKLMNQIFQQEMLHTYEQKSQSRDELVREARRAIRRLTREMAQSICSAPEIEQKMEQLAATAGDGQGQEVLRLSAQVCQENRGRGGGQAGGTASGPRRATTSGASSKVRWTATTTTSPERRKSCPRRKSSGRSRTPSSRRRSASGWGRSPSRTLT